MSPSAVRRLGLVLSCCAALAAAESWPEFRGPSGQGHSSVESAPVRWSESENVRWKTALSGQGWSSPAILDGKIWITTADAQGLSLRALAFDLESGALLHATEVFEREAPAQMHQKNTHASPTPLLEDDRVYVHFGPLGTAALDGSGEVLWRNQEHPYRPGHGGGGSPVLAGDLLIYSADGTDRQAMIALRKDTGETAWRTERGSRMAFSTPLALEHEGRAQVVSTGGNQAAAYDPATGKELWRGGYDGFSLVPRPVYADGLVYLTTGFHGPEMLAIRPDGSGDVTKSHVVWRASRGVPLTPSPLWVDGVLYMVSDRGIASALDAATGKQLWQARLGGAFSASPVLAAGRLYFTNEEGETTVVAPGRKYEELAKNRLDGRTLASPAVVEGALIIRTDRALYRIDE